MKPTRTAIVASVIAVAAVLGAGCAKDESPAAPETEQTGANTNKNATVDAAPEQGSNGDAEAEVSYTAEEAAKIVEDFRSLAESAAHAEQLTAYMDAHMPKLDPDSADVLFSELEKFYKNNDEAIQVWVRSSGIEQALIDAGYPEIDAIPAAITDEQIKKALNQLAAGKYRLFAAEGMYFSVVDYEALKQAYGSFVSAELSAYISLMAAESSDPTSVDAAIRISWKELANRALAAESYMRIYPQGKRYPEVKGMHASYVSRYINGSSNTSIHEGGKLKPEVEESYRTVAAEHPGTMTGAIAKEFLALVDAANGVIATEDGDMPEAIFNYMMNLDQRLEEW